MLIDQGIVLIQEMSVGAQCFLVLTLGLCVGSFLNVVIYRLSRSKSIVSPSSRCGFCRSSIRSWMNIPLLSFIITGGRCSECGYAYSIRYPIVEALNAILYFVIWSIYGWDLQIIIYSALSSVLLAMSFIDLEFRIIPDVLSLGGWAVAIVLACLGLFHFPLSLFDAIVGSLCGYFAFWFLSRVYAFMVGEEGLGGGDVKLMGLIGAVLGLRGVFITILLGSMLGALVGVLTILILRKSKKFPIPFGPFLAAGAFAAIFGLDRLWWP